MIVTGGGRLVIERDGSQVTMTIEADDDYQAMTLYDQLIAGAHAGEIRFTLKITGQVQLERH